MTLPQQDYIRSFLRDYRAQLRVGLNPSEKNAPQTIIVNVEMEAAEVLRYDDPAEESRERVIDYAQVYRFIKEELPKAGHIPLLESIAEMIIAFCFRNPRIAKVRVRLEKADILPDAVLGIEMFRVRERG